MYIQYMEGKIKIRTPNNDVELISKNKNKYMRKYETSEQIGISYVVLYTGTLENKCVDHSLIK